MLLLDVLAMIVGTYYSDDNPLHISRRVELLEPILERDRLVRAYKANRRTVPDIDPDGLRGSYFGDHLNFQVKDGSVIRERLQSLY